MRPVSLEPLTLPDVDARHLVEIAARTGFGHVGMILVEPAPSLPADRIVRDATLRREVRERMRELGVRLHTMECFNLTPDADFATFSQALEVGAELGARTGTAILWENDDRSDALRKLARLCDMAAEVDIAINVEFFASSNSLDNLSAAVDLVRDVGRSNAGIVVDLLHLVRTGASVADMAALPPGIIGGAQICDGPLEMAPSELLVEAGGNRLPPGEGAFPVRAFVDALPDDLVIGVEVPQVALIGSVTPEDRARRLADAVRRLFADGL